MSKVFFVPCTGASPRETAEKAMGTLWDAARFDDILRPHDLTAVKIHVGEPGRETRLPAAVVAPLVRAVAAAEAHPSLTDTAVLYRSPRDNGVTHACVAHDHGYNLEQTGAPFLPADGITGSDEQAVQFNWGIMGQELQERIVEHASAVI